MGNSSKDLGSMLVHLKQELIREFPSIEQTLIEFDKGNRSKEEVLQEIKNLIAKSPDSKSRVASSLLESFNLDTTALATTSDRKSLLESWGFDEEDLVYTPDEDRPDYKMLHPLLMGMIVEVLQFDGDIPELRTGRLPEGGSPAVPVKTQVTDPVALGAMLKQASDEVAQELIEARKTLQKEIEGATEDTLERLQTNDQGISVPGYGPGKRADFRVVSTPSGSDLARLPFKTKQELAHKSITSTQGRRSAVEGIANHILKQLHNEGYAAIRLLEKSRSKVFAEVSWTVSIDGGKGENNPQFNFINVASNAITSKLKKHLAGNASRYTPLELSVVSINNVAERQVGWKAVLYEKMST